MREHPRTRLAQSLIGSLKLALLLAPVLLGFHSTALALNPSLEVSQYAHTSWTLKNGYSLGSVFAMAQTSDGYLWLGGEYGLFRFDGVRFIPWQPPLGQQLPSQPYSLLVTRDGTLWIGTFAGLVSWNGAELTRYPEVGEGFVTSLLEDRDGTVWAGILAHQGKLCAIQSGRAQCYLQDGAFGSFVWSLGEDSSGTLWAGAESGLWRWKPGAPKQYAMSARVADMTKTDDGRLLFGVSGAGLREVAGEKIEAHPIHSPPNRNGLLADREVDSNKLLRDRDGGLWIGTHDRGLIHVHHGRTDLFTKSDGLSGNVTCTLFEDREGNVWFATPTGLDQFRELPATTISTPQGLSSDATKSVIEAADGSLWVATHDGLNRWKDGQFTVFRQASGLPDDATQSLFQDYRGRIWVSTNHGLAYFENGRFFTVGALPSEEVYSIGGDKAGNLWLSGNKGLSHLQDERLVQHFPWSALGRSQQAKVVIPDQGGVWLAFWENGGVLFFKDGQVRASYTTDVLTRGPVAGLRLDEGGALWAATQKSGLSRIKDNHVETLTTRNGLPCDTIHWTVEDDDRTLWLYTACGLLRVTRGEVQAWIADPQRKIEFTLWDAADGVGLTAVSPAYYNPPVAKSSDGKLWLVGAGLQVFDPRHLTVNKIAPPVYIEQIIADRKTYEVTQGLRLPSAVRDVAIDFTALSFVAPEKISFRYKLEGYDNDWQSVGNRRQAFYTNLPPRSYRFRVMAANNSGVWNEEGALLDFSIAPAFYQTIWFRLAAVVLLLVLLWAAYQLRVRQLATQFNKTLEARVSERTRIARDLHDTLLQSFQGLLLRFQLASQLFTAQPVQAKQTLDSAIDQASEAIGEARDAVQGLRSLAFDTNDLVAAITLMAEELTSNPSTPEPPAIDVEVQGTRLELKADVRDEAYRIAGEALRNAVRHANAQRVTVQITFEPRRFQLTVSDDGKGIDEQSKARQRTGHFGLHGMRERAELFGGKLDVWSKLGSGTQVELSVPGANAYDVSVRWPWGAKLLSRNGRRSRSN